MNIIGKFLTSEHILITFSLRVYSRTLESNKFDYMKFDRISILFTSFVPMHVFFKLSLIKRLFVRRLELKLKIIKKVKQNRNVKIRKNKENS